MKRCRASGPTVETQRDFGLGATGPRLLWCVQVMSDTSYLRVECT